MKTVLYFNNQYIDNLSDLKKLFLGTISEDLRRELLASFQDGVIDKWLDEGDEECHKVLNELASVHKSDMNQMIERKLIAIFSSNNAGRSFTRHVVKFGDHCQIQDISYCKIDKNGNLFGSPVSVASSGIRFKRDEYVGFQMYVVIKITNPYNDVLPINLEICDSKGTLFDDKHSVSLNTKKNGIVCLTFDVKLNDLRHNSNKLILKVNNDDIFWSTSLLRGSSFVTLHLDDMRIPLSLVEGENGITDFYIMRYLATDEFRFNTVPMANISWKDVMKIIKGLNKKYNINFRLPSVEEWQFAAKGGKNSNSYKYAGSNNADEVAWYNRNSGRSPRDIGLKKANELGLFDMSGNIWEITCDVHGSYRKICGGAYNKSADQCRIDSLSEIGSSNAYRDIGFRLVCDISTINNLPEEYVEYEYEDDNNDYETSNAKVGFIDMGGSVLWSIEDYTKPQNLCYSDAKRYAVKRSDNSKLPSATEFEELFANSICEVRNGYYRLKSKINGKILKIPLQNGDLYWTDTKDPTTYGNQYEWMMYVSVAEQKIYDYQNGLSHNKGRTDIGNMNVLCVIDKKLI